MYHMTLSFYSFSGSPVVEGRGSESTALLKGQRSQSGFIVCSLKKRKIEAVLDVLHWCWFKVLVHSSVHLLCWKKGVGGNLLEWDINGHPYSKSTKLCTGS